MNIRTLRAISKPFLTVSDVARALSIRPASASVFCTRAVRAGDLVRLTRNRYLLRERWEHLTQEERFGIANVLQVPSYISLMTALVFYELTTQLQQDFIESIGLYRSKTVAVEGMSFRYAKIAPRLYFGFVRRDGYFIATPEKALADCLYLASLFRYHLDWSSLELGRINRPKLLRVLTRYPVKTQRLWKARWKR